MAWCRKSQKGRGDNARWEGHFDWDVWREEFAEHPGDAMEIAFRGPRPDDEAEWVGPRPKLMLPDRPTR